MVIKIKYARIKTGFAPFIDAVFAAYAKGIQTAITDNANFPTTQPLLVNLATNITAYTDALAVAVNRDKVAVGIKNTARRTLEVNLLSIASSLSNEAQGDRDKLLSSGFELYKNNYTPSAPLGPVVEFSVTDGINPGDLKLAAKGPTGARSYVHQTTPDPLTSQSVWNSFTSTEREHTFNNLESGKKYWGRIIAIGIKNQVSISDPISRIVQ